MPYDEDYIAGRTNITDDMLRKTEFGTVNWKEGKNPNAAWTWPLVTGHRYHIHWSISGLDWTDMKMEVSEKWQFTDKSVLIYNNFTDIRAGIDWKMGGRLWDNNTLVSQDPADPNH